VEIDSGYAAVRCERKCLTILENEVSVVAGTAAAEKGLVETDAAKAGANQVAGVVGIADRVAAGVVVSSSGQQGWWWRH